MTCIMASASAISVPGRGCSQRSALAAVSDSCGSITSKAAPRIRASMISAARTPHEVGGLTPHARMQWVLGKSNVSIYCAPPNVRLQSTRRGQRHCAHPAAPWLGAPNKLQKRLYTRLQPRRVPSRSARLCGPYRSRNSKSLSAVISSASSQEISSNFPSPRAPTRLSGIFNRVGL